MSATVDGVASSSHGAFGFHAYVPCNLLIMLAFKQYREQTHSVEYLLPPQSSFFRQKLTVINPLLLRRCIALMLHPCMCRCSCPGLCVCVCNVCAASVSMAGFSQSFIFHPFLPSRNTSLHQDSSAPCFWVLWLTCSSLLPSMMSFMPRGPLLSLPLSCFHF